MFLQHMKSSALSCENLAPLIALIAGAVSLAAPSAFAGGYELTKGRGDEVCEAYLKNLNSVDDPPQPMICERQLNPKMPEFKKPAWSKPSVDQFRALEFDMAKLVNRVIGQPEPASEASIELPSEDDLGWPARRRIARIDIDNDGVLDNVLKSEDGNCQSGAFGVNIAVLTEDGRHYDLEKSQYIDADQSALLGQLNKEPNPSGRRTAGLSKRDFRGYSLYDIFLYKNTAYFDLWEMGRNYPDRTSARLHVFLRKHNETREVCTYRLR